MEKVSRGGWKVSNELTKKRNVTCSLAIQQRARGLASPDSNQDEKIPGGIARLPGTLKSEYA